MLVLKYGAPLEDRLHCPEVWGTAGGQAPLFVGPEVWGTTGRQAPLFVGPEVWALEMRCILKLLGISYRDQIANEEVKTRIGNAIGPYVDLLTSVKRHKLKWYGHVTRSSGLAKTVLQGTVQGERRRGRQRKRWEDNIKEWTGLE